MDLLSLFEMIWRHKFATLPVILATVFGAVYVAALRPPEYHATSSYMLIEPPGPPSAAEVARDPELGRVNPTNVFTRIGDPSIVTQLLTQFMTSDATRQVLVRAGADSRYVVSPALTFGYATPIVEVTGVGSSPAKATETVHVVDSATLRELNLLQAAKGVDPTYRITTLQVDKPNSAVLQASGKTRSLAAVLGIGVIALFLIISVITARQERPPPARVGYVTAERGR